MLLFFGKTPVFAIGWFPTTYKMLVFCRFSSLSERFSVDGAKQNAIFWKFATVSNVRERAVSPTRPGRARARQNGIVGEHPPKKCFGNNIRLAPTWWGHYPPCGFQKSYDIEDGTKRAELPPFGGGRGERLEKEPLSRTNVTSFVPSAISLPFGFLFAFVETRSLAWRQILWRSKSFSWVFITLTTFVSTFFCKFAAQLQMKENYQS